MLFHSNIPTPVTVDLSPFDLTSIIQLTYDEDYLCADVSLPRPLRFQVLRECTRQTDRRETKSSPNVPVYVSWA